MTSTTFGDLNLTLVSTLLNKGAKLGLPYFNTWIGAQKITIPTKLFGLFTLSDLVLKYHDGYLEAGVTPTFLPPAEEVLGVFNTFTPAVKSDPYNDTDVFEEWLDEGGNYSSDVIRDYSLTEIFGNQIQIFREIPFILSK